MLLLTLVEVRAALARPLLFLVAEPAPLLLPLLLDPVGDLVGTSPDAALFGRKLRQGAVRAALIHHIYHPGVLSWDGGSRQARQPAKGVRAQVCFSRWLF